MKLPLGNSTDMINDSLFFCISLVIHSVAVCRHRRAGLHNTPLENGGAVAATPPPEQPVYVQAAAPVQPSSPEKVPSMVPTPPPAVAQTQQFYPASNQMQQQQQQQQQRMDSPAQTQTPYQSPLASGFGNVYMQQQQQQQQQQPQFVQSVPFTAPPSQGSMGTVSGAPQGQ